MKLTPTPETDAAYKVAFRQGNFAPLKRRCAKMERERDHWRKEHDRVLCEYQHRLMVIATDAIEATKYPENAEPMRADD